MSELDDATLDVLAEKVVDIIERRKVDAVRRKEYVELAREVRAKARDLMHAVWNAERVGLIVKLKTESLPVDGTQIESVITTPTGEELCRPHRPEGITWFVPSSTDFNVG